MPVERGDYCQSLPHRLFMRLAVRDSHSNCPIQLTASTIFLTPSLFLSLRQSWSFITHSLKDNRFYNFDTPMVVMDVLLGIFTGTTSGQGGCNVDLSPRKPRGVDFHLLTIME